MEKLDISIERTKKSKVNDIDFENLTFGKTPTDHIFIAEYRDKKWKNFRIEPFHDLSLSPYSLCLHYGQTVFEGMKAFLTKDGKINIFRPYDHWQRFNHSLQRMCMPQVEKNMFFSGIRELLQLDKQWLIKNPMEVMYLRPFMIATEPKIGVKVSDEYTFLISLTPMCHYFTKNLSVKIETDYVRAADGGTGMAKCGGNYGGAFYPTVLAAKQGFDQLIWTDAKEHLYIEESGMMNVMFIINDRLITPELNNCILNGITRSSLLAIAKDMNIITEVRKVSYPEIKEALEQGKNIEIFGVGTVAVISPIERINILGTDYHVEVKKNAKMFELKKRLEDIRNSSARDTYNWNYILT